MKLKSAILAMTLAAFAGTATAEDFPKGSVDYIIPFGPGGESDITARFQQHTVDGSSFNRERCCIRLSTRNYQQNECSHCSFQKQRI